MQNSTAVTVSQNYKHIITKFNDATRNVRVQACSIATGHSKASKKVTKKNYQLPNLHSGGQSPYNTTLSQVLNPHKHFGPYKFTDGSLLTLHSKIQKHTIRTSELTQFSSWSHCGGRCRVCTHKSNQCEFGNTKSNPNF